MTVNVPDRFKAANAFWIGLGKIGLTPAAVLGQARVPVTVYDGKKNLVTTAQFFALWRAVGELSSDAAAGLKTATQIDVGNRPPSTMAAYYARDYCDTLAPDITGRRRKGVDHFEAAKESCLTSINTNGIISIVIKLYK